MSAQKLPRNGALSCVFCGRAEESATTGNLLNKDHVTAHLNCLLFSSGIYCTNTPEYDDLFGFSVTDVEQEVKRGQKLPCSKCAKRGATVGCELSQCRRSFHYPCAVEAGARPVEDSQNEKYSLFCDKHKKYALSTSSDDSEEAGPSGSRSSTPRPAKRRSSSPSSEGRKTALKRRTGAFRMVISESSADEEAENLIAPLEEDPDESVGCAPEQQKAAPQEVNGSRGEAAATSSSAHNGHQRLLRSSGGVDMQTNSHVPPEQQLTVESPEDDITSHTDVCEAVLPMRPQVDQLTADEEELQAADEGSARPAPPPSVCRADKSSSRRSSPATTSPPVAAPCSEAGPSIDAAAFWKDCNTAGCTQMVFDQLMEEMREIFRRIQMEEATEEEYSLALKVMAASGKLAEVVDRQRRELEEQLHELEKKSAAMKRVTTSLKR